MLKQIEPPPGDDPRQGPIDKIVTRMIDAKQYDDAIAFVNAVGVVGQYPYSASEAIYRKLPRQDLRRPQVFGAALSAYTLRPAVPFAEVVAKTWEDLPRASAEAAVEAIVSHILSFKSDDYLLQTVATTKGSVTLRTRQDVELFDIVHLLREFDKKRFDEIVETHPDLKAALARFPDGRFGMGQVITMTRTDDAAPAALQTALQQGQTGAQLGKVMGEVGQLFEGDLPNDVAEKNFMKALDLIKGISDPAAHPEMLSAIASAAGNDPAVAGPILADCMALMKDIKDPDALVEPSSNIVEVAHDIRDDN